ncbi:hypothetical protein NQ176_g76 [Zarea fungicola]|uniref:Uncharacterized protein n=1 Tax=Zarea fungicola TaxID=93591 RepID=A0ACC1NYS2_9HYPO|nr:hypothetical protein NQ176_g76 [Lecanicillium fungicola]
MCNIESDGASGLATLPEAVLKLLPTHPAAQEGLQVALSSSTQAIVNHSVRTYLYALAYSSSPDLGKAAGQDTALSPIFIEPHVLFVACILHDLAITDAYDNTPGRFEVVGANIAIQILQKHGVDEASRREAWLAMTLHATPGIAEHLGGTVGAMRLAIGTEFSGRSPPFENMDSESRRVLQDGDLLPRLNIEKVLGDAVARQGAKNPAKAPSASWAGLLVKSHLDNPEWQGVNKAFGG